VQLVGRDGEEKQASEGYSVRASDVRRRMGDGRREGRR